MTTYKQLFLRASMFLGCLLVEAVFMATGASAGEGPQLPAFPGAEGFGAVSKGGRGGQVIKVTNLNADGPGSLAAACAAKGPRIVVFDVSGVIPGKGKGKHGLQITDSNITIAGQTAPGAGITIEDGFGAFFYRKGLTEPRVRDITIRFLRARTKKGRANHAVEFAGAGRFILDHVSGAWGQDECFGMTTNYEFTLQWCAIEESEVHLEGGLRRFEPHNFAMIMGYTKNGAATLHHNLFAHHHERCPLDNGETRLDYRNNVVYNVGGGFPQESRVFAANVVGNYLKAGPGAIVGVRGYRPPYTVAAPFAGPSRRGNSHARGNYFDWAGGYVEYWKPGVRGRILLPGYGSAAQRDASVPADKIAAKPFPYPPVGTDTAEEAYEQVTAHVGCLPRDVVSRRTVREVRTRTGTWGRRGPRAGLMEGLTPGTAPADGDKDGIPDAWEKAHGLNPGDPKDNNKIVPAGASRGDRHKGYTYIEYYINELADTKIAAAMTRARLDKLPAKPDYGPANQLGKPFKPVAALVADIVAKDKTVAAWYAVESLERLGAAGKDAVPGLVKALGSDDTRTVAFAAWGLGAIGESAKDAVPALIKELERDYNVESKGFCRHGYAAWALGRIGPAAKTAIPALAKSLQSDKETHARRPAAWALSRMGPAAREALPVLLAALENNDDAIRWHAMEALAGIGEPAVSGLAKSIEKHSARSILLAIGAAGRIGAKARNCVPALLKLVGDKDALTRLEAARALPRIDPAEAGVADALAKVLGDAEFSVRWGAARALGEAGPAAKAAIPALEKALSDKRREVQRAAALALGKMGTVAVPVLGKALKDTDVAVRKYATRALAKTGAAGVKALTVALSDKDAEVRREAVWSLGLIGPAAKDAVAALEKVRKDDPDYVVPVAAKAALKKIGAKARRRS